MNDAFSKLGKGAAKAAKEMRRYYLDIGEPLLRARIGDNIGSEQSPEVVTRTHEICWKTTRPHAHVITTRDEYCGPSLHYSY